MNLRFSCRRAGSVLLLPYLGYGTEQSLKLSGRVLKDAGLKPASDKDSRLRNLVNMYRRFETDEVPGVSVRICFGDVQMETTSDQEGYFHAEIRPSKPAREGTWHDVELHLADMPGTEATGKVLVPSRAARFGVISDLDDTVLRTNVTRKLRMFVSLAFSNARTRKPFEGVAGFYRALIGDGNPIFYVSSSPWNLYTLLVEFLETQGIPLGPICLRDFGGHLLFGRKEDHKTRNIEAIFDTYPHLPFVLIGDSGERDPEIYSEIVHRYPHRVRAIYIRSVGNDPGRLHAIARLVSAVRQSGCQLVLAPDSEYAAIHAAGEGLIPDSALDAIRSDRIQDHKRSLAGPVS